MVERRTAIWAQFVSFNFTNALICAVGFSVLDSF